MAIFRCKMCGGNLEVVEGTSFCICDSCGTKQTIPTVRNEGLQNLFNRANVLRMKSEFDKAAEIYEKIIQEINTEAEAYWGLILCKYGIEYVEEPKTYKRVPTCHRASYDAVTADEDYKSAIKYADAAQRNIYESEAVVIDEIQRGIIALAQKEDPYDVFICYKETDESGKRTQDSVIANDIYYQLKQEGFKVFYAAITLEDKLGKEYEPYIFSALNTAKVMITIGTKPEYFNAVWVKNEWSRFLKIMKKDRSKLLIPCYRDMDAYELPEEFAHLQAQDMGKIGFINDLIRGIKKVIDRNVSQGKVQETVVQNTSGNTTNVQIMRGNMALEDYDWEKAEGFFEEALNIDPECAEAYLGKWMTKLKCANVQELVEYYTTQAEQVTSLPVLACKEDKAHIAEMVKTYSIEGWLEQDTIRKMYVFDRNSKTSIPKLQEKKEEIIQGINEDKDYQRALQYGKKENRENIEALVKKIITFFDEKIQQVQIDEEVAKNQKIDSYNQFIKKTDDKIINLYNKNEKKREELYQENVERLNTAQDINEYEELISLFEKLKKYKDSEQYVSKCESLIRAKKRKDNVIHNIKKLVGVICAVAVVVLILVGINYNNQNKLKEYHKSMIGETYNSIIYDSSGNWIGRTDGSIKEMVITIIDEDTLRCTDGYFKIVDGIERETVDVTTERYQYDLSIWLNGKVTLYFNGQSHIVTVENGEITGIN